MISSNLHPPHESMRGMVVLSIKQFLIINKGGIMGDSIEDLCTQPAEINRALQVAQNKQSALYQEKAKLIKEYEDKMEEIDLFIAESHEDYQHLKKSFDDLAQQLSEQQKKWRGVA